MDKNNPFELFKEYFDKAIKLDQHEPTAVALATANSDGIPSVRIMLLKGFDERGFCVYTNLTGRKGKELQENPNAALCFYWDQLDLQVRVEGAVERVSQHEADTYFASRSRQSQIGAWASKQSRAIEKDGQLQDRVAEISEQFNGQDVPRPPFWDGFRIAPKKIEFWEKRDFRLHKRTLFTKATNGWEIDTLYP